MIGWFSDGSVTGVALRLDAGGTEPSDGTKLDNNLLLENAFRNSESHFACGMWNQRPRLRLMLLWKLQL